MGSPTKITDGERTASIDKSTDTLQAIAYEHHEIHAGKSYRAFSTSNVASGGFHNLTFLTPNSSTEMHLVPVLTTQNAADVIYYELANAPTANGTDITPRNANRNFPDASEVQFMFEDSTLNITDAIIMGEVFIGAEGAKPNAAGVGGGSTLRTETVMKRNTWYSINISEEATESQYMSIILDWYEHASKIYG